MQTNFLIIGSGIAGLSAALTLASRLPPLPKRTKRNKSQILLITKSNLLESSSRYAQAGIAAVRDFHWDSFEEHYRDTLYAGAGINDKQAVKFLVQQAPQAIDWLINLGVKFATEPTREAAHSHSRIWHTQDSTGETIEKILAKKVRTKKNITILTDTTLLDFIIQRKTCHGAIVKTKNKTYPITAGQTILATGGFGQLYARTTNPTVSVGDGLAAAHRSGARLKDLEFVQFHPTALVGRQTRLTLLSESLRGEGAVLRNTRGERFMTAYDKAAELAPRDVVARAIFAELKKGKVYLDFTRANAKYLRSRFPLIWHEIQKAGLNLAKDLIPIFPVAHYACGGVATDLNGKTNIKNLFAIGEVAATGIHGANRLASNSLSEAVVFGRAVGQTASIQPLADIQPKPPHYTLQHPTDTKILQTIRQTMWQNVGIIRCRRGLTNALSKLQKLTPHSLPAKNALTTARLITTAALKRKKSIGTHHRID